MSKYKIMTYNYIEDDLFKSDYPERPFMEVHEHFESTIRTGILDKHGHEYIRLPDRHKIGFNLY